MADYLEAFARESEEQITELNNALLAFEDDPADQSAMERIFRTAHTLKGNCGAMGFEAAEDLAHAIEDLLEAIRGNRVSVTPELMDAIFAGVDELDAMISEAVEHGEVQREASAEIATLREYAAVEGLAEPTDAEIEALLGSVSTPSDSEHSVYHVRLDVAGDPAVHGRAVVDALDDAFELLGTDPDGDTIDTGDYDGTIDAAFASVVERGAVEAALDPVDAVAEQVIADVTDRAEDLAVEPAEGDAAAEAPGDVAGEQSASMDDVSVDELLADEDVDQFDDLDEMAEDVGDTSQFEDLGDAGSFADLGITEDDVDVETAADAATTTDTEDAAASESGAPADDDEVEDAAAEFAKLKEEVDPVGFDELQDELAGLEFDEYDSDDEVGFDELLDDDELEDDGAFAESAVTASAAADAAPDLTDDAETATDTDGLADAAPGTDPEQAADATAEDLFGDADEPAADADSAADDGAADSAPPDVDADSPTAEADESATVSEEDVGETDVEDLLDEDEPVETDDATAGSDDGPVTPDAGTAEADPEPDLETDADEAGDEATTADADFDAAELLETESLDERASSFGEGGLDLSEEPEASTDDVGGGVPDGSDEFDLDDSFGEMEAEAADEAAAEDERTPAATDAVGDDGATADSLDLGEDDIDFGEGTVAGAEGPPDDAADEDVAVGGALEDDSFGTDVTEDDLAADTGADDPDETVEAVDGFGAEHDSVLDLGDSEAAGSDATPVDPGEATLDDASGDEFDAGTDIADDADAAFGDDADLETDAADAGAEATASSAIDDPGFGDAPESAGGDGPDVDEDRLERIRALGVPARDPDAESGAATTQSIRVDVESLDRMLNMVEGLVTSRARLRRALIENEPREVLEDELDDLEDVTSELQDTVMDVRLVPLRTAVNKLPRIVRDVAREQDKQVDFELVGEDVELDRSILDEIGDPLVHLVRNAVDHGVETPDVREEAGKDPEGSVELRATRERDRVTIEVEDDGAGIDADAVRDAAVEEGIHTRSEVDSMDDEAVHELIFHAGFSTAAEVTDVSGRGVGMDVVAETVDRLDGSVTVTSEPGEGTTITMELPVTLAIAEVLFVDVGGEEYGIPIKTVDEIGPVVDVETQDGQEVLVSDGGEDRRELIRLDEALSTPGRSDPNAGMLVHLRDDVREAAIHCDRVREQQEVVVKPFEGVLGDVPGLGGASVLGDGDVVTILDVETL